MRVGPHGRLGVRSIAQNQEAHITTTGNALATVNDLAHIMSGVAQRDPQSVEAFFELATTPVRRMIVASLRGIGVRPDADRLHDLVNDALVYLMAHADAWEPDKGATPWQWAKLRIRSEARRGIGQFTESLDEIVELPDTPVFTPAEEQDLYWLMVKMGQDDPRVAEVFEALTMRVSVRDIRIWLQVRDETEAGNPSPATTVAALFGLRPAAVRKVCQRVREKVPGLAGAIAGAPAPSDALRSMARCA